MDHCIDKEVLKSSEQEELTKKIQKKTMRGWFGLGIFKVVNKKVNKWQ